MPYDLHALLGRLDLTIRLDDRVLELGCGEGELTGDIAARSAHVVAMDSDASALAQARERHASVHNVTWALADGESLHGVEDASIDVALVPAALHRMTDARTVLGHVSELGRVLVPGGTAAFALSTDADAPTEDAPREHSRRELFRALAGRGPAARPRQTAVPLHALGAAAIEAGLELERIDGSGTPDTVVLARRSA
jgi:ubiquinone/menaquinone biosynthesis C-methylase UbiE